MIHPQFDLERWRDALRTHGRVQATDVLDPQSAERLHAHLRDEVPWTLAWRDAAESRILPHADYAALGEQGAADLVRRLQHEARGRYGFAYDSYMMVDAYKEGRDPGLLLHTVLEFLNSPAFLAFARELTGFERIRRVNAQATRYLPGHFLRRHNDFSSENERLVAYVINLGHDWQADWGGLLQFFDEAGQVTDSFVPRYNTLSLFRVPQLHAVSLVAPWAERPRFGITGWFLS